MKAPGGAVERAEEINHTSCASWDGSHVLASLTYVKSRFIYFYYYFSKKNHLIFLN
jgi:hypothetical protein